MKTPKSKSSRRGSNWLYSIPLSGWLLMTGAAEGATPQKYFANDGASQQLLGFDVGVSGNVLVAGTPAGPGGPGSAYLFNAATGTQLFKLTSPDQLPDDFFGFATDISGSSVVVGDPGNPFRAPENQVAGQAYLFDASNGSLTRELTPTDSHAGDEFGFDVDISGVFAAIGAPEGGVGEGSAYIFDVSTGVQRHKLIANDLPVGWDFGRSVAISGQYALVGAPGNFDTLNQLVEGAVYVYNVQTGQQVYKLRPTDTEAGNEFGWSVAVHGSTAVIGAPYGGALRGAAYVFDLTTGSQVTKLLPDVRRLGDDFGYGVAIEGNRVLVGAPGTNAIAGQGYVFDATTGVQLDKLVANDGATNDEYGNAVAMSGGRYVVGAPLNESIVGKVNPGAAYAFGSLGLCGDADLDSDVDSADLVSFIGTWTGVGTPGQFARTLSEGDCDFDGDVDSSDLLGFLAAWTGALAEGPGSGSAVLSYEGFSGPQQLVAAQTAVVPEPTMSWGLLAGLGLAFRSFRKNR